MAQMLKQQHRVDFLRHIVNRVLASSDVPQQLIEDVKKVVGRAEDRYRFDAFSGNVKKLAEYLRSNDFNDLVNIMKSSPKGLEILRRILEEAKKAYRDIPEVVEAIEERLREIGEERPKEFQAVSLVKKLGEKLREKGFKILNINEKGSSIEVSKNNIRIRITGMRPRNSTIIVDSIEITGLSVHNEDELIEMITRITES